MSFKVNRLLNCFIPSNKSVLRVDKCFLHKNGKWPKRSFSGIQPTGVVHLGNYFGAIQKWIEIQNRNEDLILSVVDLHSISLPQNPKQLKSSILTMTASLIACGIDPNKCILFQQSMVPQHALLGWALGTLTTMTRLYHFPQYKEKSANIRDVPLGLFTYPVLQAADILLYKTTHVPVGEDQLQHLNLAQHLVHTFNNRFGVTFPFPECVVEVKSAGGRIKSLREPDKKMSKSHTDPKSRIELTDSPDVIVGKIKKSLTDFTSEVSYDPEKRPGVSNLIDMHCLATGKSAEDICSESKGIDTGKYKLIVADALIEKFSPIRDELLRLVDSPDYLQDVLNSGSEKAEKIAQQTWYEVSTKMGFEVSTKRKRSIEANVLQ